MVKDIKKLVEEANMTLMEVEGTILTVSISNQVMNTTSITQISEDLWYLV